MQTPVEIPVLNKGYVRYIDHMGTDQRIVEAARVSYRSPSKGESEDEKLLNYLYKNRHTSPFEMCKITFNIKMPIFIQRQFIRHRMQNFNEVSARYTELPDDFYIPEKWRAQDKKNKQSSNEVDSFYDQSLPVEQQNIYTHDQLSTELLRASKASYQLYENLLAVGVAREMARMILPVNIYTEFYCCWDLKNLLHFFSLRDDPHAQYEHQLYGRAMKEITRQLFPVTMKAYDRFKWELKEVTV
jgi:thymidylate synthase (FAD)